ncbi:hypothetical protein F4809DRAFT_592184, partial [Biscogniauxia mediterranea]
MSRVLKYLPNIGIVFSLMYLTSIPITSLTGIYKFEDSCISAATCMSQILTTLILYISLLMRMPGFKKD